MKNGWWDFVEGVIPQFQCFKEWCRLEDTCDGLKSVEGDVEVAKFRSSNVLDKRTQFVVTNVKLGKRGESNNGSLRSGDEEGLHAVEAEIEFNQMIEFIRVVVVIISIPDAIEKGHKFVFGNIESLKTAHTTNCEW